MQLESHATPPKESPQLRYAALHRAIERGLDSDEVWRELAEVSLQLGHSDEAVRCLRRIRNAAVYNALQSRLSRLGLVAAAQPRGHATAPAASDAGTGPAADAGRLEADDRHEVVGLRDHVVDAVQFLGLQHMPWLVLLTTLSFPLVVGLGGFLTAGGSPLLLAAIAALPGLCVLAVVGAMGRQILLTSSEGSVDVPPVPEPRRLLSEGGRFLADAGLVVGSLIVPPVLGLVLGAPLATTLPGLLVGAFFAPMAWALRQVRGDFGSLSPVTLLRGVGRCGFGYLGLAAVCWALFAPAVLAAWAVFGRPVWVQIAAVGPFGVLPLFVVSRLLGTWLDTMRLDLGGVLLGPRELAKREARTAVPDVAPPQTPKARTPRRPEKLHHFEAPKSAAHRSQARAAAPGKPAAAAAPQPVAKPRTQPAARPAAKPPAPPAARPAAKPVAKPVAKSGPAPAPKPQAKPEPRAIEGRGPRQPPADAPDLTRMPGAVVVSGGDRARQGASSRPR